MNAAGLKFALTNIAMIISSPVFFDKLTSQGVSAAELHGTRSEANALAKALDTAPPEKMEELVTNYSDVLDHAFRSFQGDWQMNQLQGFRDAQVMIGFVRSLCNKLGIFA